MLLVMALEASFGTGVPAVNDQIVFGRVRIRIDVNAPGNYTVTYPYGVLNFPNVDAGNRAINFTGDIGLAVGDFAAALKSEIGPFLQASDVPGGAPAAFYTVPLDASGDRFLSDGATPVPVTGSPTGNNFFEICTDNPNGLDNAGGALCQTYNLFVLMGKVHLAPIGSPLAADRATYARDAIGAHVDVFATATSGPGAATPVLSMGDAAGTAMPSVSMNGPTALNQYYGQGLPTVSSAIPAAVTVTNVADNPPSSVAKAVVDEVTITQADYDPATGSLTITATSSDKGLAGPPVVAPPQLIAIGLPGSLTGSDPLVLTGSLDPAEQSLTFVIPAFGAGPVAPPTVSVISSAGGQETQAVAPVAGPAFVAGGPTAVDDGLNLAPGGSGVISVLANDIGVGPAAVATIASAPANGAVTPGPTANLFVYTPNPGFVGDDAFTYFFANGPTALERSNVATVTVTVQITPGVNNPPVAGADIFSTVLNTARIISAVNLLANDSDPDPGTVLSISGVSAVSSLGGTIVNVGGTFTTFRYTPPAGITGADTFTYTLTDGSLTATGTVTVNVVAAENITVLRSNFVRVSNRWRVNGTTTALVPGNFMTVTLVRTGQVIGVVAADPVTGVWALDVRGSSIIPQAGDSVLVTATSGASRIRAVTIQ